MKKMYVLSLVVMSLSSCTSETKKEEQPQDIITHKELSPMTPETVALPSGLSYEILKSSDSNQSPKPGQKVVVHYTGWLEQNGQQGRKFDSSVDRGEPFVFIIGIGQVIQGWDEGVMSMKVGEKRRLHIPPQLGYGARGAGNVIPPNATLMFDVELLGVA